MKNSYVNRAKERFWGIKSTRTKTVLNNIVLSLIAKGVSILSNLLILPLTINYVNPTQYGIWLTLSSVISWMAFFDFGLGNGFRNKFSKAMAENDILLARQYLSTAYFIITVIVSFVFIVLFVINPYIDWTDFLKIDKTYQEELSRIFVILSGFFSLKMIVDIFGTMLTADQKNGLTSLIIGLGQFFSLVAIYILTKVTDGSLTNLAIYFAGVPCIVMLLSSIIAYSYGKYRIIAPRMKYIRINLIKDIMNLGLRFFIVYLCLILTFQIINIVITREIGPEGVTQYNVAHRYFNIVYMIIVIILGPIWSAFTDAYVKKDFSWMKSTISRLEKIWLISIVIGLLMFIMSPFIYQIWIGDSVQIPLGLSFSVFVYTECQAIGAIYMHPINGLGYIRLQTIIYIIFALICWPAMVFACRNLGLEYASLIPASVFFIQALLGKKQLTKIVKGEAKGMWIR